MVDLAQTPDYLRPATSNPRDRIVGYDELGREIRQTLQGVQYLATDVAPVDTASASGRGFTYNLLDNIIGYDDGVMTPGERLGAGVQALGSGLLSDPVGTARGVAESGYGVIQRLLAGTGTPMDAVGAASIPMGVGGLVARPAGSVGMGGMRTRPDIRREVLGTHHGQMDMNAIARIGDTPAGRLEYSVYEGVPRINMIDVAPEFRRQGVASELLQDLQRQYPDVEIDWGMTTPDGTALYNATPFREVPGPMAAEFDRLDDVRRQMAEVESTIQGRWGTPEANAAMDRFYALEDEARELEYALEGQNRVTRLIDTSSPETPAQQVARLLREGRADEVTDDLMAQADPQEMARLYEAGETGMDMPLDEASRMARAREMGFDTETPLYHGTPQGGFSAFDAARFGSEGDPGLRGLGVYTSDSAGLADRYAERPRFEGRFPNAVRVPEDQMARSVYPVVSAAQSRLDMGNLTPLERARLSGFSGQAFNDAVPNSDAVRYVLPTGDTAEFVDFDPTNIRSRFARFDPRLSHLANLNAANIDPLTGAVAMGASQQQNPDPLATLRAYLDATGGVLGR